MTSLNIEFCGISFKNPFILASAPPTKDARAILKGARAGWAGAVTKTIGFFQKAHPKPRLAGFKAGTQYIGMENIELISEKSYSEWCAKEIPLVKKYAPSDFILVASIMGGTQPSDWQKLAEGVEEAGADMIEMNVSCPHGMPEKAMGMFIGQDEKLVYKSVKSCKKSTKLPVIVKVSANVTDIKRIVTACVKGGADGITAINTFPAIVSVDIWREVPLPEVNNYSAIGGLSGNPIKPIALRVIAEIKSCIDKPVSGCGGIMDANSAIQFLQMGATTVQLCTAVMWYGFEIISNLKRDLTKYMHAKRYDTINDFIGNALKKLTSHENLKIKDYKAFINAARCTGCKRCMVACSAGAYGAIAYKNKKCSVNLQKCDGCGLCVIMCRRNAIKIC